MESERPPLTKDEKVLGFMAQVVALSEILDISLQKEMTIDELHDELSKHIITISARISELQPEQYDMAISGIRRHTPLAFQHGLKWGVEELKRRGAEAPNGY